MMREIKFRSWDLVEKRWYGHEEMMAKLSMRDDGLVTYLKPTTHLMQYTGIKDKNGVDIYEGDIVQILNDYRTERGEVVYKDCQFLRNGSNHALASDMKIHRGHVIGNIYENPELLEKERP